MSEGHMYTIPPPRDQPTPPPSSWANFKNTALFYFHRAAFTRSFGPNIKLQDVIDSSWTFKPDKVQSNCPSSDLWKSSYFKVDVW